MQSRSPWQRRWIRWCTRLALALALPLTLWHSRWASGCRTAMVEEPVPEPERWRAWPLLPGQAGYEVVDLDPYRDSGLTSWRPHAMSDARLAGHGVCAERGASVQSWFGQFFTAVSGNDWALRLRQEPESGVVLVTAELQRQEPHTEPEPPRPIVAFRVARDGPFLLFWRVVVPPAAVLALLLAAVRRAVPRRGNGAP